MARTAFTLTAGSTTIGSENFGSARSDADPADQTSLAAAMAVLVADAASPTQAHVTTANTALTAITPVGGKDLVVSIDRTKINSISSLRAAFNLMIQAARSSGMGE